MNDGGQPPGHEVRVVQHRLQEGDVGGHPADPELRQRPPRLLHRLRRRSRPRQVSLASIESKCAETSAPVYVVPPSSRTPGTAGRAVGGDLAGVRTEPVGRVLGGDPALQRRPAQGHRLLGQPEVGQRLPGRDPQLGLHQVDVGDLLGHRVLDLDPWVHLDEHVPALRVEQELDGAGVDGSRSRGRTAPRRHTSGPAARGRDWVPARSRRPSGAVAAPSSPARTGGSPRRRRRPGSAPRCAADRPPPAR